MSRRERTNPFQARRRGRRLTGLKPYLLTTLVGAVLAFAGYAVFFSPWLAVQTVAVSGTHVLGRQQVLVAAGVQPGTPLIRVDLDSVEHRVAQLRPVDSVVVHRSWPHTVTIHVSERRPIAAVAHDGTWWWMDDEGVLFRDTGHRDHDYPVVAAGKDVDHTALREAAAVVSALPPDLLHQTKRIMARSMDSITVKLKDGRQVVWGSAAESSRKVQVLAVLLRRPAKVYDVSVPEQPTTRG